MGQREVLESRSSTVFDSPFEDKQFVVWKTWLFELDILSVLIIVPTLLIVIGHKVIETDIFYTVCSLRIVFVQ